MTMFLVKQNPVKLPRIRYKWYRDGELIRWNRPLRIMALGIQGSSKSSILEVCAVRYKKIIDILGSCDGESLCWCKPEFINWFTQYHDRPPKILLLTGEGVKIASVFDTVTSDELTLQMIEDHDVVTTAQLLHQTKEDYHKTMTKIIDILETRIYWKEAWCLLIREAAHWAYARMKIFKDDEAAKSDLVEFFRENRHHGLAVLMDALRWTDLDKIFRDLSDYLFVKQLGDQGLPKDLRYCYRYWKPKSLRWLKNNLFGIKSVRGSIGVGQFARPIWHKEETENILETTRIERQFSEKEQVDERRYGVGDLDHATIIEKYIELKSIGKVASEIARSKSTIHEHIKKHNVSVDRFGECQNCKHSKSIFSKDHITKGKET